MQELPRTIERLIERRKNLEADQATMVAHAEDLIEIDGQACHFNDVPEQLGHRLESLPGKVSQTTRFVIGQFRGLMFGLLLDPNFRPDVFLKGAMERTTSLARDHPGPRAVLNALDRLAGSYAEEQERAGQDLTLAEGQLRDYEARRGRPFQHEAYLAELERSRNALKDALSGRDRASEKNAQPSAPDLAQRIKELQTAHTIDADARRPLHERVSTAEEPIAARVRRRVQCIVGNEPQVDSARKSNW